MENDFDKTQPGVPGHTAPVQVPERCVGLWQRLIDQRGDVAADVTSHGFWLQTRRWCAEVGIPAGRPTLPPRLTEYTRTQLLWLAQQEGFTGIAEVEGEVCTRVRDADFRPPSGARDIARLVFIDDERIVETGLESRYMRVWERVPGSNGLSIALERVDAQGDVLTPLERIVVAGEYLFHIRARGAAPLPPAASMIELVGQRQPDDDTIRAMVDFEISFARQTPQGWRTQLSTLPFLEGRTLIAREALPSPSADGFVVLPGNPPTQWRVLEWIDR